MLNFKCKSCQDCWGGDSCCTSSNTCKEGEGDCDLDSDCAGVLVCGTDNCRNGPLGYLGGYDSTDDCCKKPSKYNID